MIGLLKQRHTGGNPGQIRDGNLDLNLDPGFIPSHYQSLVTPVNEGFLIDDGLFYAKSCL